MKPSLAFCQRGRRFLLLLLDLADRRAALICSGVLLTGRDRAPPARLVPPTPPEAATAEDSERGFCAGKGGGK